MASNDYPNQFFIGRKHDPDNGKTTDEDYVYDPDDLTTHAAVSYTHLTLPTIYSV